MKEFQMFFFDVDGTLLDNHSHRISPAVIEALHTLQQRGKKIVISSGRDVHTIMSMPQLAAIQWDGYICRNGSVVADQVIFSIWKRCTDSKKYPKNSDPPFNTWAIQTG